MELAIIVLLIVAGVVYYNYRKDRSGRTTGSDGNDGPPTDAK